MLVAVALLSFAMLAFEVLQTVVLSLQLFQQTAFLVVSHSMLGLGAGGSLVAGRASWFATARLAKLWLAALGFGISLTLANVLSSRMTSLVTLILTGLVPYVFAGVFLALVFRIWPRHAPLLYGFNLAGSAVGCLAVVELFKLTGEAGTLILVTAFISLAGAVPLAVEARKAGQLGAGGLLATMAVGAAVLGLLPFSRALFSFAPFPAKHYGQLLADPAIEKRLDWSRWGYLGRLDAVIPGRGIERFRYGGTGIRGWLESGADFRFLFASGDNWSYVIDFGGHEAFKERFVREAIPSSPYHLVRNPHVLCIGVGGGVDIFLALQCGARSVTGIEINPLMIQAFKEVYGGFWDGSSRDSRVKVEELDGRTFVNEKGGEPFDVITLTAVDTGAALAAGGMVLSENYLYTREAFDQYFRKLTPDGVLFILRPRVQLLRAIVTARASLRGLGASAPDSHFVILGADEWLGALISRSPMRPERLAGIAERAKAGYYGGVVQYLPGTVGERNPFRNYFLAAESGYEEDFLKSSPFDLSAVRDDKPYYYQMERSFFGSDAGVLLLRILAVVGLAGAVLILLPLRRLGTPDPRRLGQIAAYFGAIGVGFMCIEIGLIQRTALFLGHPSYSISVTLFSLLVGSGLGSLVAGLRKTGVDQWLASVLVAIVIATLYCAFLLPLWLRMGHVHSLIERSALVCLLVMPVGFLLGWPFSLKLRSLTGSSAGLVPWAWGVNAFASVVGSVIAVMVAMTRGFHAVLLAAAASYLVALLAHLRRTTFNISEGGITPVPLPREIEDLLEGM
jgi:SAM-dependent methyltransferase